MAKNHLYESKDGVIHVCNGSQAHPGVFIVWTKCGMDVPPNKSFKGNEVVTCPKCKELICHQQMESGTCDEWEPIQPASEEGR